MLPFPWKHVAIDIRRGGDTGMSQAAGDLEGVLVRRKQDGGMEVPEVMEPPRLYFLTKPLRR